MNRKYFILFLSFICLIASAENAFIKKSIFKNMQNVADWQLEHFEEQVKKGSQYKDSHAYWAWTNGAMYVGMFNWAKMTRDKKYFDFLKTISEKTAYNPGPNVYFADDICVSQLYLQMFKEFKDSAMLYPTLERMDYILANRKYGNLDFTRKGNNQRWSWCDALFMAPPAYAQAAALTSDIDYLKYMDEEFKVTYDSLYDQSEKLFFRDTRFKTRKEANGEKIFWGRGNGWVIGGLCRIIDNLPENHVTRSFYIQLYKEMIERISGLQDEDGFWHSSLLDVISYPMPETSSSALFTYGLAWGVNNGILPKGKYKPIAIKGWKALCSAVHKDGKLGWVQPIGADPKKVTSDMTDVYGVGAFLLAGSEMYQMK